MSLLTRSQFFYGHSVTQENWAIDFNEGGPEIQATLNIGDYTLEEFAAEVASQMTAVGGQVYTCSVNRTTRALTIASTASFTLLASTGTRVGSGAWTLMGFAASDFTGTNTYTGASGSGSVWRPQALFQDHTGKEDFLDKADAVVHTSAAGIVQMVSWGDWRFHQLEAVLITNNNARYGNSVIEADASGLTNFRAFMDYAVTKQKMEYMPDRATPGTFDNVLLEKSSGSSKGTGYRNKEYDKADGLFRSGPMTFRVVEI